MKSYAVTFNYSFDDDVAVYLFDTQEDAVQFLVDSILAEYKIEAEENGFPSECEFNEDKTYGVVRTFFKDETDVMEARVGNIYL